MPTEKEFLAKKAELDLKQDKLTAGDNITINSNTNVISATYPDVTGATSQSAGAHGLVPAPAAGDESKFLKGDGTWDTVSAGSASLAGLTDVDLDNPTDGQALVYDAANQEWVNGEAGNTDYVELTQAEYNALTPEEQMNGTLYFITDGEGGGGSGGDGDTNVYGAFIDTNRIIKNTTTVSSTTTYTATEDCIVAVTYSATSSSASSVGINGVTIFNSGGSNLTSSGMLYLKKSDTMTFTPAGAYNNYTVYGLTFGTQNIFTPQIYSTEERVIGVWIDDKPLYQKTMTYQFTNTNDVYHDFVPDANAYIVNAIGLIDAGGDVTRPIPIFYNNSVSNTHARFDEGAPANGVRLRRESGAWGASPTAIVTLQYTKTTDVAGSGSYNTLGVPMVHIEDNVETVIGTYNGKPLYQMKTSFTVNTTQQMNGFYRGDADLSSIMPVDIDRVLETTSNMQNPNSASRGFVTSWYETDGQSLFYLCLFSTSGNMGHTTIKYTKTTD